MTAPSPVLVPLAALTLSTALAAQTLIVDPAGGPGTHVTIQAAVNAAPSGATIEVRPSTYQELVAVVGKALTIRGTGSRPDDVTLADPDFARLPALLTIRNQPPGTRTVLAKLALGRDLFPGLPTAKVGVDASSSAGEVLFDHVTASRPWRFTDCERVWLQRCSGRSAEDGSQSVPSAGLALQRVAAAVVTSCAFVGGRGFSSFGSVGPGAPGVAATQCELEVVHPAFTGGVGGTAGLVPQLSGDGGPGLYLLSSNARITGDGSDRVRGGDAPLPATGSQRGGAGAELVASDLDHGGIVLAGGAAPTPGPPWRADAASTVTLRSPVASSLALLGDFRVGQATTVDVRGAPGRPGAVFLALGSAHVPSVFGPIWSDLGSFLFGVPIALDGAGRAQLMLRFDNDPGQAGAVLYLQPATVETSLVVTTGGPAAGIIGR